MRNKSINFLEDNTRSLLLKIAIPSSFGFFFNTINNLVDQYWAGQLGLEATTALGRSFPFIMFLISLSVGLSSGAGALIANWLGQNKEEEAEVYHAQTISLSFFVYLFVTLPLVFLVRPILIWMETEGAVLDMAVNYTVITYIGSIVLTLSQAFDSGLRARGLTKYLGIAYSLTAISNFILNPFFSQGFILNGLEIIPAYKEKGLAYVTIITTALGAFYLGYIIIKKGLITKLHPSSFVPKLAIWKEILGQMIPSTLAMAIFSFSMFINQYFLKKATGSEMAIAATTLGFRIENFAYMPTVGLNIAMGAVIGQNNGAKNYKRIKEAIYQGFFLRFVFLFFVMGIVTLIFPKEFVGFFIEPNAVDRNEVIHLGVIYLNISFFNCFFYATLDNMISALQGIKKPQMVPLAIFVRAVVLPIIIFNIVLSLGGGYFEIIASTLFSYGVVAIAMYFYTMNLIRKEEQAYLLSKNEIGS